MGTQKKSKNIKYGIIISAAGTTLVAFILLAYFVLPKIGSGLSAVTDYKSASSTALNPTDTALEKKPENPKVPEKVKVEHLKTPVPLKGIYMTSWVAGTPSIRQKLVKIADETEVNAIVIDVKDYSGKIVFEVNDPVLKAEGSEEVRVKDMREFLKTLHDKGIYTIARIAVFQDAYMVKHRPDWAVTRSSDGAVWKDYKGISWIDMGAKGFWDYITALSKETYDAGFDEINFDYIRFPSDGNMKDIAYPWSDGRAKHLVMRDFYEYLNKNLKPLGIPISADLFGMTTTNTDDLNIGQILEDALAYFDYVSPMVYPSHYPPTFRGYGKPAQFPYEIVKISMASAVERAVATSTTLNLPGSVPVLYPVTINIPASSTTPALSTTTLLPRTQNGKPLYTKDAYDQKKLRPWLQDFNLGATYTPDMVRAQIKATYDVGLDSWLLWDAANTYTVEALEKDQ